MKLPPLEEMRLEFPGITLQDYEELQALPEKIGVDEKKEPEQSSDDAYNEMLDFEAKEDASEEEPNQEELWKEVFSEYYTYLYDDDRDRELFREIKSKYHIQKLKP